jgi:hypothetical protein
MINRFFLWVYAKLELIVGAIAGTSTIVIDINEIIIRVILAFFLGLVGAVGASTWKSLSAKYKKLKQK